MPKEPWKRTEALQAATENEVQMLWKLLNEGGADVEDASNNEKQNLLHVAAYSGAQECLETLLQRPRIVKKINAGDRNRRTPMHLAAAMGFHGCVQKLIDARGSCDPKDDTRSTPLHLAVKFDWTNTARYLLEAGADPHLEDASGHNAVDLSKGLDSGSETASLMVGFSGRQRSSSSWTRSLRSVLTPWRTSRKDRADAYLVGQDSGTGAVRPDIIGNSPTGDSGGLVDREKGQDWQKPEKARSSKNVGYASSSQSPGFDQNISRKEAAAEEAAAAGAAAKAAAAKASSDFAMFRIHAFFDESIKRLEFEVAWKDQQPAVGNVKPGGEAESRGLVPGDRLVKIGGVRTTGKGRDDLLPVLKQRPLLLEVDREARTADPQEPHIKLELTLCQNSDIGIQVQRRGNMPVVSTLQSSSAAWSAGVLEGDAIMQVDSKDVTGASEESVLQSLKEGAQRITICRRPLGMDTNIEWTMGKKSKAPLSRML
eukprot:TRINITY_DN42689_c0_g1_i1.p1 TRINITY_DN42689_c0_g1~~TRINITY_DN42689_c0_g1_i1.p1  ORF type:complete len:484 (-),score=101.32 TRINITY_DN42689_c0_g1_i1:122-1573(-)